MARLIMLLSDGVIAQYRFNESSGLVAVDSVGDYDGTLNNMEEDEWVAGKVGNCLHFDGVDEYVDIADFQSLFRGSFSICCWAYSADWSVGQGYLIGYRRLQGGLKHRVNFEVYGNGIYFDCECEPDGIDNQQYGNVLVDGEWAFVVGTANAITGKQCLYYNGILIDSDVTSVLGGMPSFDTNGLVMPIGSIMGDTVASNFFGGLIDNVMLFNRAISLEEIKALYNNGNGREVLLDNKSFFHNANMTNYWGF